MYLAGVIPGPSKPSLDEINPYLGLLVDELLEFWTPGVKYSRTSKHSSPHLVRAALLPLICDILAARQVAGMGSHSSKYFCSFCLLPLDNMEDLNKASWPRRTAQTHRQFAERWQNAASVDEREKIFAASGVRWSELLRLPYWDPINFTVVDSMHNLYLGLLKTHCRDIWGMSVDVDDSDATTSQKKHPKVPSERDMAKGLSVLYYGSLAQLQKCRKAVLWYLCLERDLRRAGTVKQLSRILDEWTSANRQEPSGAPRPTQKTAPKEPVDAADLANAEAHMFSNMEKALARWRKSILLALCDKYGVASDGTKPELATRLIAYAQVRCDNVCTSDEGPENKGDHATYALGRQAFTAIREVRENMELPSWINQVPRGFGTTEHGKLSADQWHTAGTVLLPVALIWLWGNDTGRKRQMLANFLDLVTAVVLAGLWTLTEEHIDLFESHMLRYLAELKQLYKEIALRPNHHLALHIPDCMRLFGPVPSWRAFVFERFNYMLQRLNTNLTFGEMEGTFMKTSCRAANLRVLLQDSTLKSSLAEFLETFRALSGEDERGMRLDSILRSKESFVVPQGSGSSTRSHLDEIVYNLLLKTLNGETDRATYVDSATTSKRAGERYLSREAQQHSDIIIRGIHYRTTPTSLRDSNVQYRLSSSDADPAVGRIRSIFTHSRKGVEGRWISETFLVVDRLEELSENDARLDNFRRYPYAGGRLYYEQVRPSYHVIRPPQIICHVARTPLNVSGISSPTVHVLPLDRVRCLAFPSMLRNSLRPVLADLLVLLPDGR
ncbi:hypothetical protein PYCCODRAFT_1378951 [Trametes coccinea BRFM310]|uniref:SAP domain-containing protein n=1 Tax=Trametes coccinea (strain BRFM310) TaxID=1353009 RepID=A0A1Y2I5Y7_TRAC3|nr:hypothetical protein PYCCODRAFT_1378951 [Trametes coccinea BRFM310]